MSNHIENTRTRQELSIKQIYKHALEFLGFCVAMRHNPGHGILPQLVQCRGVETGCLLKLFARRQMNRIGRRAIKRSSPLRMLDLQSYSVTSNVDHHKG